MLDIAECMRPRLVDGVEQDMLLIRDRGLDDLDRAGDRDRCRAQGPEPAHEVADRQAGS